MQPANRQPTEFDVRLRRLEVVESVLLRLAAGVAIAVVVGIAAIPIAYVQGIVHEVAGKKTTVDVSVVVSISFAASVAVNLGQLGVAAFRRAELRRLRDRINQLEAALGIPPTRWNPRKGP
ncbi:MAG TPA: hypothetical protein VEA78_04215 [Acidimicrobiales bacterium]|nr:hypothetical protein [Acidimicrobiales bacterium]